jgi:hypothetical protein
MMISKSGNKGEKIQKTGENGVISLIVLTVYQTYWGDQVKEGETGWASSGHWKEEK